MDAEACWEGTRDSMRGGGRDSQCRSLCGPKGRIGPNNRLHKEVSSRVVGRAVKDERNNSLFVCFCERPSVGGGARKLDDSGERGRLLRDVPE